MIGVEVDYPVTLFQAYFVVMEDCPDPAFADDGAIDRRCSCVTVSVALSNLRSLAKQLGLRHNLRVK